MKDRKDVGELELYAWVGWDEFGSGELGLKQGIVPAGTIPMVAIDKAKLTKYWDSAENQAAFYGKRIFLVKFKAVEIIQETKRGEIG